MRLFAQPGKENNLSFELRHKAIIDRLTRYPHLLATPSWAAPPRLKNWPF
ncbi:hypothetical protein [Rhodoferax sp.]|nr:hypothetical protein [Rhodoferax sp.]MDZ7919669.1 hypothetical protein [Rhodoferax sp.]